MVQNIYITWVFPTIFLTELYLQRRNELGGQFAVQLGRYVYMFNIHFCSVLLSSQLYLTHVVVLAVVGNTAFAIVV
jgi:hypothetical protein